MLHDDSNEFSAPSRLIDGAALRAQLASRFADASLDCVAATGSTNSDLQQLLRGRDPFDTRIRVRQADLQTAGRGRLGRSWQAGAGDALQFSVAWPLPRPLTALGGLSLCCGLAVATALQPFANAGATPVLLKWPNDVLVNGAKLAGILLEIAAPAAGAALSGPTWIVIGIGINLRPQPELAKALGRQLAAVAEFAPEATATEVLAAVLNALAAELDAFGRAGFGAAQARWQQRDAYAGQTIQIIDGDTVKLVGRNAGVDADGQLLVDTGDGIVPVLGGDVSLRIGAQAKGTP